MIIIDVPRSGKSAKVRAPEHSGISSTCRLLFLTLIKDYSLLFEALGNSKFIISTNSRSLRETEKDVDRFQRLPSPLLSERVIPFGNFC